MVLTGKNSKSPISLISAVTMVLVSFDKTFFTFSMIDTQSLALQGTKQQYKISNRPSTNQIPCAHHRHRKHRTLTSTSLARLPLGCAARRSARLTLARYRIELAGLILLASAVAAARKRLADLRDDHAKVPTLVATTLDRLATQAALYSQGAGPESWISVGQLRDDVLRDEFSAKRRERLWKRVKAVVEMNANVRASVREGRGGDVSRVWEWIGSVGFIEDAWAVSGRRESSRLSLGPVIGSSPVVSVEGNGTGNGNGNAGREMGQRRWDEGRPMY